MGAGIIVQNNVAYHCQSVWKNAPKIPEWSADLSKYNKGFISFVSLVGAYALYKSSVWAVKKGVKLAKRPPKIPSTQVMQQKYGNHSWVLVVDCKQNQDYCVLLAKRGFNLILCGEQEDITIAKNRVFTEAGQTVVKVESVIINWEKQAKNIKFFEELDHKLKDLDISILVMPRIRNQGVHATYSQKSPVFEHVYLSVRQFGPRLKWRSYSSAIIFPSTESVDTYDGQQNGVTRAVQSGVDAFGRTLQYEFKGAIDIVIARGSAQKAIANLGKNNISH